VTFAGLAWWQALAFVLAAGAAAAWLFRLKVRPPMLAVPSLALWARVIDQQREQSWWERVRRAVSLAATVLIAVALALAFARPAPRVAGGSSGRVLLVLDSSWSMRARTSTGATRWDRAVAEARRQLHGVNGEVALATTAEGIVEGPTSDAALIETALERLQPSGTAAEGWLRLEGWDAVHLFTDGANRAPAQPGVTVHSVFERAANVAVTAFAARAPLSAGADAQAYVEVTNFSRRPEQVHLLVTRGTDRLLDRHIELAAGDALRQVLPLAAGGDPRLRATVQAAGDALDIDNEATAWLEAAQPLDVAIVSESESATASLIALMPGTRARVVRPAEYHTTAADLFVFEGWLPAEPPGRPALVIAPPSSEWLGSRADLESSPVWLTSVEHPVVQGVDLSSLTIQRARRVDAARLASVAESAGGTALVAISDDSDRRVVVLPFGPGDSNLLSSPAFPVLVGNAVQWLGRPPLAEPGPPGTRLLPSSTTRVISPAGRRVPLVPAGDRVVARFDTPGLYLADIGGARSVLAINAIDPVLSNLEASPPAADRAVSGSAGWRQPWWTYAVLLAFVLLTIEWWTWQRRITV
jgi:hypothetical protein